MSDLKPGDPVWYMPRRGGPRFAAVVDSQPWCLGEHTVVVRLRELGDDYREHTGRQRTTVPAAACSHIERRDLGPQWSPHYPTVPGWYWVAVPGQYTSPPFETYWRLNCLNFTGPREDLNNNPSGSLCWCHDPVDCQRWAGELEPGCLFMGPLGAPPLPEKPPASQTDRWAEGNFCDAIVARRESILEELAEFYGPEDAAIWLDSAQPLLGGATPMQRVREGKADDVEELIDQLRSGAYV